MSKNLESNEIPVQLDDLPNFRIKIPQKDIFANDLQDTSQEGQINVAYKFINQLENLMKENTKDSDSLLILYDYQFNKICQTVFKDSSWPAPHIIENAKEIEIELDIQTLYNELCYRHALTRLGNNFDVDLVKKAWENYSEIFDTITNSQREFPLPTPWIWDIIDEYIYQFYIACRWRRSLRQDDEKLKQILQNNNQQEDQEFWNLKTIIQTFQNLIQRSKILQDKKLLSPETNKITTSQYFGYFSLIGLLRIHVLIGDYESAVKDVECISLDSLQIFSKSIPAYLSLFYYAGFAYLMTGRYRESVKIFESACLMMNKYKSFLTKSFQYENIMKQLEKTVCLFAIALSFAPNKDAEASLWLFKDITIRQLKQNQNVKEKLTEKYEKLKKFDVQVFFDFFNNGCPKIITPIKDHNDFVQMQNKYVADLVNTTRDNLLKDFQQSQNINNITEVLKLYTRINVKKAASLLKITTEELVQYIQAYLKMYKQDLNPQSAFEQTILAKFLIPTNSLNFEIQGETIIINEIITKNDYAEQFQKMNKKVKEIEQEINLLK